DLRFEGMKKTISAPRQRFDKPGRIGRVAHSLANLPDAEIQALLEVDESVVAPDTLADFGARQNLSTTPYQEFQYPKGLRRQLDTLAVSSQLSRTRIQLEYVETKNCLRFTHRKLMSHSWRVHVY